MATNIDDAPVYEDEYQEDLGEDFEPSELDEESSPIRKRKRDEEEDDDDDKRRRHDDDEDEDSQDRDYRRYRRSTRHDEGDEERHEEDRNEEAPPTQFTLWFGNIHPSVQADELKRMVADICEVQSFTNTKPTHE
eukprot:m.23413 g.23413  ORF g.23413 m.23413 type:complete len:135 (-) comp13158_c0_seq1:76-480(-)